MVDWPFNSARAGAAVLLRGVLTVLLIMMIVGMIVGLISHWVVPITQRPLFTAVPVVSDDARFVVSRKMQATKQRNNSAAKDGQQKKSRVLAAKAEKTPPTMAAPRTPGDGKSSSVAKNDAATKPLQHQPPSPPAPLPQAGEGSLRVAAKPKAGEGRAKEATTCPAWVDAPPRVVDGVTKPASRSGPIRPVANATPSCPRPCRNRSTTMLTCTWRRTFPVKFAYPAIISVGNWCKTSGRKQGSTRWAG